MLSRPAEIISTRGIDIWLSIRGTKGAVLADATNDGVVKEAYWVTTKYIKVGQVGCTFAVRERHGAIHGVLMTVMLHYDQPFDFEN